MSRQKCLACEASTYGQKAHALSLLGLQIEVCMGMASTRGNSFVSPCLTTIVLL